MIELHLNGVPEQNGTPEQNGAPAQTQRNGLRGETNRGKMSESSGKTGSEQYGAGGGDGYTPASFEKRAAAWMGIAYTVMMCFVLNYAIYTGGRGLPGTFPLFLVPVSVALAVVLIRRMKLGACPGGTAGGVAGLALCAAGIVLGLALGWPALLSAFTR